ncbi:MAG: glycosyltransferase [Clostridia bacterium]|nr:glycosyltransferase [Clostridia bacterium]
MKFSVIVPVYNVEKYIANCLDSILSQSYADYEVLVINDGSPDNSQEIIDGYVERNPEKIKAFVKENGGLSDARNYGIERAVGDYLLFVDSDDYIDSGLLQAIASLLEEDEVDIVRFSAQIVYDNGQKGEVISAPKLLGVNGVRAIDALIDNKYYFEPAWLYAYKTSFWRENGFSFAFGKYHEDFGTTPKVIMKAESFSTVDMVGYYYVQSPSSIMRTVSEEKERKRAFDCIYHYDSLLANAEREIKDEKIKMKFRSYLANSMISKLGFLSGETKNEYLKAIIERDVFELMLDDTLMRKLKKLLMKIRYCH